MEFAYAYRFCPAPDALTSGAENFEWVVEESAKMAIAAKKQAGKMNLTWEHL
jgi:hypothetical protein